MGHGYDGNRLMVPLSQQDHVQGSPNAVVVLIEYGNYQCRNCGEVHRIIQQIQQQHNTTPTQANHDRLCFVFRHFPNPHIHPQSQRAAEAVESAAAQGQFW